MQWQNIITDVWNNWNTIDNDKTCKTAGTKNCISNQDQIRDV